MDILTKPALAALTGWAKKYAYQAQWYCPSDRNCCHTWTAWKFSIRIIKKESSL